MSRTGGARAVPVPSPLPNGWRGNTLQVPVRSGIHLLVLRPFPLPAAPSHSRALPYLRAAVFALACYVAGRVGLSLAFVQASASPVWPASGVAMAGLLLLGIRYWPAVYLAAVAVTLSAPSPLPRAMVAAAGNVLDAVIGAWVLTRVFRIRPSLSGVRDVLRFIPLGSLPGPAASAAVGVGALLLWGVMPLADAPWTALVWWTGNGTGVLVAAPLVLAWAGTRKPLPRARLLEVAGATAGAVVITLLAFRSGEMFPTARVPLSYAVFPFVTWAAMRGGQRGASVVTASVTFAAVATAARLAVPGSPFAEDAALLFLQGYLALVSMTGMVLAALTHERRTALRRERRARRNAQAAERRSAFLAEVGAVLSGSLDYPETLAKVAALVVPRLADGCILDELTEHGSFGRVVTRHRDPATDRLLAETRRLYPPPANPRSRVAAVLGSRRTDFLPEVDAAIVERLAVDERHRRILEEVGIRSVMFVPLVARERTVGVLTLMRTAGARPYTPRDVALAEEVARRAALYIDNARLYRSVRSESAARQKVVSMVSHEVRNPLSTILLNATAALDDGTDGDGARQPLDAVILAAEQIHHLVQDLADVTRLEAGSLPVEHAAFRPGLVLREAAMMLEPLATRRGLRFGARAEGELPPVVGDRERTLQVLSNLVGNALRHTPEGGEIEMRAEAMGGVVRFCVADSGSGIAPEAMSGLFTPLWSGDVPARGMGLPLSRAIVEAQGGRLWAESTPGEGSRFFFTLPVDRKQRTGER